MWDLRDLGYGGRHAVPAPELLGGTGDWRDKDESCRVYTNFVIQPRITEAQNILSASFVYDSNFYTRTKKPRGSEG